MAPSVQFALLVLLMLAACVWLGGYVAIAVVAGTAKRALDAQSRVTFFRALGRAYLPVGLAALIAAFGSGALLLDQRGWDVLGVATACLGVALVVLLGVAVVQARRMTRLRQRMVQAPDDAALASRVKAGGLAAAVLRALLGALSAALLVLGCLAAA